MTTRTAYDWIDDIERMQGGPNGPTIRLRACVLEMENEAFALAAGQCANVVGDEGGTPQCAELTRLRAEVEALKLERDGFKDALYAEMDENWRLRETGGALPSENMTEFLERLIAENRALQPPHLKQTGGWWAITGARLIVESRHPVGYTTHRELCNAERKEWSEWIGRVNKLRPAAIDAAKGGE